MQNLVPLTSIGLLFLALVLCHRTWKGMKGHWVAKAIVCFGILFLLYPVTCFAVNLPFIEYHGR